MANPLISLATRALKSTAKRTVGRTAVGRAFKAAMKDARPVVQTAKKARNVVEHGVKFKLPRVNLQFGGRTTSAPTTSPVPKTTKEVTKATTPKTGKEVVKDTTPKTAEEVQEDYKEEWSDKDVADVFGDGYDLDEDDKPKGRRMKKIDFERDYDYYYEKQRRKFWDTLSSGKGTRERAYRQAMTVLDKEMSKLHTKQGNYTGPDEFYTEELEKTIDMLQGLIEELYNSFHQGLDSVIQFEGDTP